MSITFFFKTRATADKNLVKIHKSHPEARIVKAKDSQGGYVIRA